VRLSERVYLVGSGSNGFDSLTLMTARLSDRWWRELALIDVGAGMGPRKSSRTCGARLRPRLVRHLILTHGTAITPAELRARGSCSRAPIYASGVIADSLRRGDEKAISIDVAKQAASIRLTTPRALPVDHELEKERPLRSAA